MSHPTPATRNVRALRIPADGSPPHLITLETMMTEPVPPPQSNSYEGLLSHLGKTEKARHVPNVKAFWTLRGWEDRTCSWVYYGNGSMKDVEGMDYIFLAVDHDRLPPNRHLSTDLFDCCGDVFLLKMVHWPEKRAADYADPIDCLRHPRHEHRFPEYADVDDRVLGSDLLEATVRELLRGAVLAMKNRGEMVDEDKYLPPCHGTPSGKESSLSANVHDEPICCCPLSLQST